MDSKGVSQAELFQSGVSFAYSMTSTLQLVTGDDGTNFVDVPGLKSVDRGPQAAQYLTEALQNDGDFKILFVIILAAGKPRSSDVESIKAVLQCATDIQHYGIVINQMSQRMLDKLKQDGSEALAESIKAATGSTATPHVFLLQRYDELEDQDNVIMNCPELIQFMDSLPSNEMQGNHVEPIPVNYADEEHVGALQNELNKERSIIQQLSENLEFYKRGLTSNIFKTID